MDGGDTPLHPKINIRRRKAPQSLETLYMKEENYYER